ncbi:19919_t:CDS:2, partial [Gigaspora margarita]
MDRLDSDKMILLSILNVSSSIGYLELNSNNPFDQPRIHLNFLEKSGNLYRIISLLKLYCEIFKQPPMNDISDEDWKKFVLEK